MARPIAAIPVQIPIALAFALGSVNAALTKASDATFTIAAPMPWKPRATMSAAMLGASPQATDATQNTTMPTM